MKEETSNKQPNKKRKSAKASARKKKIGWVRGVLVPVFLNMTGVMLYMRMSMMVAQCGLLYSLIIIISSNILITITISSLSAISSNGIVFGGGLYYFISRLLGPEAGASLGLTFAFANTMGACMNTIGFNQSIHELLTQHKLISIDEKLFIRMAGPGTLLALSILCIFGFWNINVQIGFLAIIFLSLLNFLVGAFKGPNDENFAKGFVGLDGDVFRDNLYSDFRTENHGYFKTFFLSYANFFPSVSGIQVATRFVTELKDPANDVPKGTFSAVFFSVLYFLIMAIMLSATCLKDASGNVSDINFKNKKDFTKLVECQPKCPFGMHTSYSVPTTVALWGPLMYLGTWFANLSKAFGNIVTVPRALQSVAKDGIYPGLGLFSKGFGKTQEPLTAYSFAFVVISLLVIIGRMDYMAPLTTNLYLGVYAMINFCAFHAAHINPLSWRPTYKYYNLWVSLFSGIMCVVAMFVIHWIIAACVFILIVLLYVIVLYHKPDVNWGSTVQARTVKTALTAAHRLVHMDEHVKTYYPQPLVLTGAPQLRPALLDLASLITQSESLLICADIIDVELSYEERLVRTVAGDVYLNTRKIRAFYIVVDDMSYENGALALMQCCGLGKLSPNMIMVGYMNHWYKAPIDDLRQYVNTISNAFDRSIAVTILRMHGGLAPEAIEEAELNHIQETINEIVMTIPEHSHVMYTDSNMAIDTTSRARLQQSTYDIMSSYAQSLHGLASTRVITRNRIKQSKAISQQHSRDYRKETPFTKSLQHGMVDVWWLYDDGGLTILVPYIITHRSKWGKTRIFVLVNQTAPNSEERLVKLLQKLRIGYSSLTILQSLHDKPKDHTVAIFHQIVNTFNRRTDIADTDRISGQEITLWIKTIERHLKLRELIEEHSKEASLIILSLNKPSKGIMSPGMYMTCLEVVSREMPPFLFIRGNQTSVISAYL